MLSESYRILNEGGVLRIATPDLNFLFKLYSNPTTEESKDYATWAVEAIPQLKEVSFFEIGTEEYYVYVINNFFKAWGHQVIHTKSSIEKLALQCGFSQVRVCSVGESEVSQLRNIEKHGSIIPERINLLETMVLEFIK
jgi:predicted SAM-dependent methyltransferase